MIGRKYRAYTKEFKKEALELLKRGNKSAAQIERELGITKGMLLKWRDRYELIETGSSAELGPSNLESAKAKIRQLERQLAEAEEEKDILKKAVSIFSRRSK